MSDRRRTGPSWDGSLELLAADFVCRCFSSFEGGALFPCGLMLSGGSDRLVVEGGCEGNLYGVFFAVMTVGSACLVMVETGFEGPPSGIKDGTFAMGVEKELALSIRFFGNVIGLGGIDDGTLAVGIERKLAPFLWFFCGVTGTGGVDGRTLAVEIEDMVFLMRVFGGVPGMGGCPGRR